MRQALHEICLVATVLQAVNTLAVWSEVEHRKEMWSLCCKRLQLSLLEKSQDT